MTAYWPRRPLAIWAAGAKMTRQRGGGDGELRTTVVNHFTGTCEGAAGRPDGRTDGRTDGRSSEKRLQCEEFLGVLTEIDGLRFVTSNLLEVLQKVVWCEQDGRLYDHGEAWELDSCTSCSCQGGQVVCRQKSCPPAYCVNPTFMEEECCPVCLEGPLLRRRHQGAVSCAAPPPSRTAQLRLLAKCDRKGRVDGLWGMWSPWSTCTTTCGEGSVTRVRLCNQPPPQRGGRGCPGPPRETQPCRNPLCPEDDLRSRNAVSGSAVGFIKDQHKQVIVGYHGSTHCVVQGVCVTECVNTDPGFYCLPCPPRYRGSQPYGLGMQAALETRQLLYQCSCAVGYAGDGFLCADDSDLDGWPNHALTCKQNATYHCQKDNCPLVYNPRQVDSDRDGIGDRCDN
ncbi:hypothetical protein CRUP_017261 [Coryphaenoides rupestris]|nr:hypothetical protein CRUP_017261 [Coryphaenoides rupestris]